MKGEVVPSSISIGDFASEFFKSNRFFMRMIEMTIENEMKVDEIFLQSNQLNGWEIEFQ